MKTVCLGVGVREFRINLGFTKRFPSHLQITNEFVVLASMVGDFDNI